MFYGKYTCILMPWGVVGCHGVISSTAFSGCFRTLVQVLLSARSLSVSQLGGVAHPSHMQILRQLCQLLLIQFFSSLVWKTVGVKDQIQLKSKVKSSTGHRQSF